MVLIAVSYSNKATTLNDEAAALRDQASRHQTTAKPVQAFNDFAGVAKSRTLLVGGLAASRFPWDTALFNLSETLPSDVTLDTINATTADTQAVAANQSSGAAAVASTTVASLNLAGCTSGWIGYSRFTVWLKNMPGVASVKSAQSNNGGAVSDDASDPNAKRASNCGPSPLKFTVKVYYEPREVDLVGLPKIDSGAAGASGATGAAPGATAPTTGAPAAASTGAVQ
jgi:Tfp pilus assembly protein PilN